MTKVSEEDLGRLRTAEDRDACTGGTQDRIDAVLTELLALRRVADAVTAYSVAHAAGDSTNIQWRNLQLALHASGR